MSDSGELVSSGDAAVILGVSPRQIARWANAGALPHKFRGHGVTGAFVFDIEEVRAFAQRRKSQSGAGG